MITNIREESDRLCSKRQPYRNRLACSYLGSLTAIDFLAPESYIEHYFMGKLFGLPAASEPSRLLRI